MEQRVFPHGSQEAECRTARAEVCVWGGENAHPNRLPPLSIWAHLGFFPSTSLATCLWKYLYTITDTHKCILLVFPIQ